MFGTLGDAYVHIPNRRVVELLGTDEYFEWAIRDFGNGFLRFTAR